jgi:hypothetical protein
LQEAPAHTLRITPEPAAAAADICRRVVTM